MKYIENMPFISEFNSLQSITFDCIKWVFVQPNSTENLKCCLLDLNTHYYIGKLRAADLEKFVYPTHLTAFEYSFCNCLTVFEKKR
jgi:hypothetical protein